MFPFLYHLETPENQMFSGVSGGLKETHWPEMDLKTT